MCHSESADNVGGPARTERVDSSLEDAEVIGEGLVKCGGRAEAHDRCALQACTERKLLQDRLGHFLHGVHQGYHGPAPV